jgi:membrane-associated phospholipid phosphatase
VTTLFAEVSRPTRRRASRIAGKTWDRLHDPHVQLEVVLALVFLGAITAFGHVVEDYLTGDPIVRWDVEFSRWLHIHSSPALVSMFSLVTWAGNTVLLAAVTLGGGALLYKAGRRRDAYVLLGGALGIEVLNALLKLVFHRPRPELASIHLDTYSFPSGHAAGSVAIYGILLYLFARGRRPTIAVVCSAAYVVLVATICFSRLYLEVHYLSDVLAGASLGLAWAAGCVLLRELNTS